MSLSCCSHRPDRTRHASAVRLLLLFFFVELFQPQNDPSPDYLWLLQRSVSYAAPTFLTYASVDSEISSSLPLAARRLFCPFFISHVRFGRSSCSSLFSNPCSFRASVVVPSSALRVFFLPLLSGLSIYLLSMHTMFLYPTPSFVPFHSPAALFVPHAPFTTSPPLLRQFGLVSFPSFCFACPRLHLTFPTLTRRWISAILRLSFSLVDEAHACFLFVDRSRASVGFCEISLSLARRV